MPELHDVVAQMKTNKENWKNYVETDKDKEVYQKKKEVQVILDNDTNKKSSEEENKTNNN